FAGPRRTASAPRGRRTTRRTRRCSRSTNASATKRCCGAWSTCARALAQRKGFLDEPGQDLRRDPDRRRRIGARAAVAAVRGAQAREERESLRRRLHGRCDERLDRERRGLRVRRASRNEPEAAARRLELPQVRDRATDRSTAHTYSAQ